MRERLILIAARVGHQPIVIDEFPDFVLTQSEFREGARAVSRQRAYHYQRKATSTSM